MENDSRLKVSILALLSLLQAGPVRAEEGPLAVIPLGEGEALQPTIEVATAIVEQLVAQGKVKVKLAYLPPALIAAGSTIEKQATRLLRRAENAYHMMEYEKVKASVSEACKLYQEALRGGTKTEGYLRSLHLLAASALMQGEKREALRVMADAILFDPKPPAKREFSPEVQALHEQARTAPPTWGTLDLRSNPPALVWLNGTLHGLARGSRRLHAGRYLARFYRPGYASQQLWVHVEASSSRAISVALRRDGSSEGEVMAALRAASLAGEPGPSLSRAARLLETRQLLLITGGKGCTATHCRLELHWINKDRWLRRSQALFKGDSAQASRALLTARTAPILGPDGVHAQHPALPTTQPHCGTGASCPARAGCPDGACPGRSSLVRRWWFWSLIGAGVVGVTLAVALPLTAPPQPVIEVR